MEYVFRPMPLPCDAAGTSIAAAGLPEPGPPVRAPKPRNQHAWVFCASWCNLTLCSGWHAGISIAMVSEAEVYLWARTRRELGAAIKDPPQYEVERGYLAPLRKRLSLVERIDKLRSSQRKVKAEENWCPPSPEPKSTFVGLLW